MSTLLGSAPQIMDRPAVGAGLMGAGLLPAWFPNLFSSTALSSVYYLLLIPPAAYHCYRWIRKAVWPSVKYWIQNRKK